jgi:hypothetical protein
LTRRTVFRWYGCSASGLAGAETLHREGAPIPMKSLPCWDNGRDVVLAGDAAGVVAPASGEGICYAMVGGQLAAEAVRGLLLTGDVKSLKLARKRFMKMHGTVFMVLGIMQWFWYCNEKRRERFVKICDDRDVQQLTFESHMNKKLTRKKPMAHVRILLKDMSHLLGMAKVQPCFPLCRNSGAMAAGLTWRWALPWQRCCCLGFGCGSPDGTLGFVLKSPLRSFPLHLGAARALHRPMKRA